MDKKIRLGFIGCGKHALKSHLKIAITMPKLFVPAAVFDIDTPAMDKFANIVPDIYKAKSVKDLLLNTEIDAVIIATPHQFHLELFEQSINAHKHTLCEKPLWVGVDAQKRGKAAIQKAKKRNLVFTSCHPRRFAPEYLSLQRKLNHYRSKYGNIMEVNFCFSYHQPSTQWKKSDSLLLDHMNHEIDIVNFLLGQASVNLQQITDSHDRYHVVGTRADGVNLCFSGYRRLPNRIYVNELELIFERGRIRIKSTLKNGVIKVRNTQENFNAGTSFSKNGPTYAYKTAFIDVMKNFGKAILGMTENYLTGEDLITNTVSCNALIKTGKYVS